MTTTKPGRKFNPERFRSLRALTGLTQQEFGDRTGVTRQHVQQIETGDNRPSVAYLERVAEAFDVDIRSFFDAA